MASAILNGGSSLKSSSQACGFNETDSLPGVFVVTGAILAHDSLTYGEGHIPQVVPTVEELNPPRTGPKNLPTLVDLLDDENDDKKKPRLVIVGAGWGAMGVLKTLNPGDYEVVVVADSTFNQFTPLLPSAAVGTVGARSLIESVRKLLLPLRGSFVFGKALDVVMNERLLEVEVPATPEGDKKRIYVPYDKLIIAVGSVSATHGVTGLENCFQLKTIEDAQKIRRRIIDNVEIASLPTATPEERKRLLSFVICGGGPTGVEVAAEISDLVHEDLVRYFPKLCAQELSITIIQSRDHILNTYSESISQYAEKRFEREKVNVITNARVKEVTPKSVKYTVKDPETGKTVEHEIPTEFTLWSTGIAMNPFTQRVTDLLPNQVHKKAIVVDAHMRVVGAPLGTVYCIGDASTIETSLMPYLLDLIEKADINHDEKIDRNEWDVLVKEVKRRVPMASTHLEKVNDIFKCYDTDADDALSFNELTKALEGVSKKITTLPATAQVASQQGKYLGKKFTLLAKQAKTLHANGIPDDDDEAYCGPFQYKHLGSLAYIGNAAVFDLPGYSFTGGLAAMYAWRSVYWSEQVSFRTRALLMVDWIIRGLFGRDLSRL
ncbi:hypothetical protein FS837_003750 [Tulasnella sp. UAMH 9824]|nr:hypothetical protein FS837_003750 [Tulasnella sp. UAMH 9824]